MSVLRATVEGREPLVLELDAAGAAEELAGWHATVPTATLTRELPASGDDRLGGRRRFEVVVDGWRFEVLLEDAARAALRERAARLGAAHGHATMQSLQAQIPGRIVSVDVAPGDAVEAGQRLLSVEAMKMENEVRAPRAGTVERVAVAAGQTVDQGDELVVIS
jgi:biotin carboxyl carrier protein